MLDDGELEMSQQEFTDWAQAEEWWTINTVTVDELFGSGTLLDRISGFGKYKNCESCDYVTTEADISKDFSTMDWHANDGTTLPNVSPSS